MFTIDLLKGRGLPRRSGPRGIVFAAVAVAVPLLVSAVMLDRYLQTRTFISIQKQAIINHQAKVAELAPVVKQETSFREKKALLSSGLLDVASCLVGHIQWSPVLVTLVENMPEQMVMTGLSVRQKSVRRLVSSKDRPREMVNVDVPSKTLSLSLTGNAEDNCDRAVKDFRDRLKSSALLGAKLEDITVSQESDKLEDRSVVSYGMDCIFKPEL